MELKEDINFDAINKLKKISSKKECQPLDNKKLNDFLMDIFNKNNDSNYITLREIEKKFYNYFLNDNQITRIVNFFSEKGILIDTDITTDHIVDYTKAEKNSLKVYLSSIPKEILTEDEEIELAKRKDAGDEEARNELINHNLRLVVNNAMKFRGHNLSLDDLIAAGNLGLIEAANKYDYKKGRFTTYATWWIKARIMEAITEENQKVKLPTKYSDNLVNVKKTITEFSNKYGRSPTDEEIKKILGDKLTIEEIKDIRNLNSRIISLDEKMNDDANVSRGDILIDSTNGTPYDYVNRQLYNEKLDEALNSLDEREKMIIEYRYGLKDGKQYTFKEISPILNISAERIRQIEARAIKKIKELVGEYSING